MKHSLTILVASMSLAIAADPAGASVFEEKVRPLLEKHCVECHGAKKQKGELRLDAKVFAFKGGHDGPVIVAGDAAKSPFYARITSKDDDERMPPKGEPLSAAQISLVKAWIESGAVWPENATDKAAAVDKRLQHWSVQPVKVASALAETLGLKPELLSIDAFIKASLSAKGLAMSPEADRRTLIRRLSFDLTGLPPTPERVEQFVRDMDPQAYEKLVDELLKSPHYGERWARHWLDIAHYADTHGFERDQLRPNAWRYRDYVIESLNADKPYDHFLREQIAGDVLAPGDSQSVIATGFLAAGPWDFVGHVETKSDMLKRAARAGDLDDMVTQVITSTVGITINCARCHDHKLDPITQQEYYRLWAVFAGVKRGEREVSAADSKQLAAEKARISKALVQKRAQIAKLAGEGLELATLIPKDSGIDVRNGAVTKDKLGYHRDIQPNRLQKVENVPGVKWVFVPDGKGTVTVNEKLEVKGVPATSGHFWDAIANRPLNAQHSTTLGDTDFASKGHTMLAMHANSGITFDLAKLREQSGVGAVQLTGLVGFGASKEAAASRADFTVFVDAGLKFQKLKLRKDETARLDIEVPATAKTLTLVATDGGDGIGSDLLFIGDPKLVPEAAETRLTEAEAAALKKLHAEARKLESDLKALPESAKVFAFAIVSEAKPSVIKVQRRGNPEDEGAEVVPAAFTWAKHAPVALGDNATPEGQRRRALAEWITHPDNPLTRRVLVNRLWHHHFGQGLVTTPSDFGLGGDKPSHPELLDWLAGEFLKSGWSLKHMHKLIVTSAAYRQQSGFGFSRNDAAKSAATLDSANRLLWRQNPRRLDAESLHDAVLAVSGTLNPAMGGPGYRDFNYTEAYAPIYDYITPDKPELWRRSIYRFIVRTTPHQFMSTLDCPDPANLTPARVNTTTALQALTLSNNDFMLQQARHLVTRIENETDSREAAIRRAFALTFQRAPTAAELQAATPLVTEQGLFALCRMLINANEFVYLD
jgi:mono/diheme cytochrome c family protein